MQARRRPKRPAKKRTNREKIVFKGFGPKPSTIETKARTRRATTQTRPGFKRARRQALNIRKGRGVGPAPSNIPKPSGTFAPVGPAPSKVPKPSRKTRKAPRKGASGFARIGSMKSMRHTAKLANMKTSTEALEYIRGKFAPSTRELIWEAALRQSKLAGRKTIMKRDVEAVVGTGKILCESYNKF